MFKNFRWYITLWFVGLSAVIYILLSIVGGAYFYTSLSTSIDEELKTVASQIGHAIDIDGDKPTFREWLRVVETEPARSVISMQLYDASGVLLEHYGPLGIPRFYNSNGEFTSSAITMRMRQSKLVRHGKVVGFLQLQLPVDKRNAATHEFLLTMTVMAPFVLLAFGLCSYAVAGLAVEPIEELVFTLRRFVADAGHELNTPTSVVQARAQSLERKLARQASISDDISIICSSAQRIGNIVQDLMLLAELDAKSERRLSKLDWAELARVTLDEYVHRFENKGITLVLASSQRADVIADKESLERILRNLLDNALKYTNEGGAVKVWFESSATDIRLIVEDTGIGIPEASLPNIFERFYRVDKSRARASGGSGLGLSIIEAIVESLNGHVIVESQLGKGSKFIVSLPHKKTGVARKLHTNSI